MVLYPALQCNTLLPHPPIVLRSMQNTSIMPPSSRKASMPGASLGAAGLPALLLLLASLLTYHTRDESKL